MTVAKKKAESKPVVVPAPIRKSDEHVEDVCFEGLIRKYTSKQDWEFIQLLNMVYGKVLTDRSDD